MANRYFFDKRDMKYFFIKYGVLLLIAIPLLIGANILFIKWFNPKSMVFLDIVFLCVILTIYEAIWFLVKRKKAEKGDNKRENK